MASSRLARRSFTSPYSIFFAWLNVSPNAAPALASHAPFGSSAPRGIHRKIDFASTTACIFFPCEGEGFSRNWDMDAPIVAVMTTADDRSHATERLGAVLRRVAGKLTAQRDSQQGTAAEDRREPGMDGEKAAAASCRGTTDQAVDLAAAEVEQTAEAVAPLKGGPTSSGGRNVGPCRRLVGDELVEGRGTFDELRFATSAPCPGRAGGVTMPHARSTPPVFNSARCAGIV